MNNDEIHIVLAANEYYSPGFEVAKASIIASANDSSRIVFHEFTHWPESISLPRKLSLAYIRLFLPELLSEDFIIWSDVDVLWRCDVAELWDCRSNDSLIKATRDCSPETLRSEECWMKSHGYPFSSGKYFCSGVMIMNLKKMREIGFVARCLEFVQQHDDLLLADQSVLNALFFDEVDYLHGKWNVFSRDATMKDFCGQSAVIHYAGEAPWVFRDTLTMLTDTRIEWFKAYAGLVKRCSLWEILRKSIGFWGMIYRRILFLVASNNVTWPLLRALLILTGRTTVVTNMRIWARRI